SPTAQHDADFGTTLLFLGFSIDVRTDDETRKEQGERPATAEEVGEMHEQCGLFSPCGASAIDCCRGSAHGRAFCNALSLGQFMQAPCRVKLFSFNPYRKRHIRGPWGLC